MKNGSWWTMILTNNPPQVEILNDFDWLTFLSNIPNGRMEKNKLECGLPFLLNKLFVIFMIPELICMDKYGYFNTTEKASVI